MLDYLRIILAPHLPRDEERGASAVEFGLLVAGIAAVIVAVVFLLGGQVESAFDDVENSISSGRTS